MFSVLTGFQEFVQCSKENYDAFHDFSNDVPPSLSPSPPPHHLPLPSSVVPSANGGPRKGDIRTEFHDSSHRPPSTVHFEDYGRSRPSSKAGSNATCRKKPWEHFKERIDFEVAELVHAAAMTNAQAETLLSLLHRTAMGEAVMIKNHKDIVDKWEKNGAHHT